MENKISKFLEKLLSNKTRNNQRTRRNLSFSPREQFNYKFSRLSTIYLFFLLYHVHNKNIYIFQLCFSLWQYLKHFQKTKCPFTLKLHLKHLQITSRSITKQGPTYCTYCRSRNVPLQSVLTRRKKQQLDKLHDRFLQRSLKGQLHEIFDARFFFISQPHLGPWLTSYSLRICRDNRFKSR
jgi:hypothetical protein